MKTAALYTCEKCAASFVNHAPDGHGGYQGKFGSRINGCDGELTESTYTRNAAVLARCEDHHAAVTGKSYAGCGMAWFNFAERLHLAATKGNEPEIARSIMADIEAAAAREFAANAATIALGGRAADEKSSFSRMRATRAAVSACKSILKVAAPAKSRKSVKPAAVALEPVSAAPVTPARELTDAERWTVKDNPRRMLAADNLLAFWSNGGPGSWAHRAALEFAANNSEVKLFTDEGFILAVIPAAAPVKVKAPRKSRKPAPVSVDNADIAARIAANFDGAIREMRGARTIGPGGEI